MVYQGGLSRRYIKAVYQGGISRLNFVSSSSCACIYGVYMACTYGVYVWRESI